MSFISKPKVLLSKLPKNERGLTIREYEGAMSTLCAGCGHELAALPQAPMQDAWASPAVGARKRRPEAGGLPSASQHLHSF